MTGEYEAGKRVDAYLRRCFVVDGNDFRYGARLRVLTLSGVVEVDVKEIVKIVAQALNPPLPATPAQ